MNGLVKGYKSTASAQGMRFIPTYPGRSGTNVKFRYMETPFTTNLTEGDQYYKYIIDRTPAGRWGKPEDLRGAVIFLASPASNFITGSSILVDGGMLAK